jgi:Transposase DDE domain
MVVVMLHWGHDRIPVAFEMVRRTDQSHHRSETRLFRWMLIRFRRPAWAEMVVVVADAAFASKANLPLIQRRGDCFVMALARTWGVANGHALKELVTHVPKKHYRRCWGPLDEPGRRRTYWTYTKRACLRHIGDVTMVLSKQRHNDGPNATQILVTNLPAVTTRQVLDVYRRRWAVELLLKALTGATGWGQHQVTKDPQRVKRSIAVAVRASLVIVKFRAQDIPERGSWSIFTLKRNFTWQLAQAQVERSVAPRLCKEHQQRQAA